MDLNTKSLVGLKKLKKQWYIEAKALGLLTSLAHIARVLGKEMPHRFGPKYQYKTDTIYIYVDDYSGHMKVIYKDKVVCDTHFCKQLFVYGAWVDTIKELVIKARKIEQNGKATEDERIRLNLISELTAPA